MFYIRDIDTKKYISISNVNGKKSIFLTSNTAKAWKFSDDEIKVFYKKLTKYFPDRVFWPDYIKEESKDIPVYRAVIIFTLCLSLFLSCIFYFTLRGLKRADYKPNNNVPIDIEPVILTTIDGYNPIDEATRNNEIRLKAINHFGSYRIYYAALNANRKYDVPIHIIYTLIATESDGLETAKSNMGCIGLTQISKSAIDQYNAVHKTNHTKLDAWDIELNIEIGVWNYRWCLNQIEKMRLIGDKFTSAYVMYNIGYMNYKNPNNTYANMKNGIVYLGGKKQKYGALNRFQEKLAICEKVFDYD